MLLLAIPSMLYLTKGQEEHYATIADESRDYFSREDLEACCENPQARFDVIEHPSNNSNYVITGEQNKKMCIRDRLSGMHPLYQPSAAGASEKCTRQNAEKTKMQNMVELYCGRVFCRIHESLSPASHRSFHPWK